MYSRPLGGHREEYNVLFECEFRKLGYAPVFANRPSARLFNANVFFLVIDDDIILFIACALMSVFTGKRVGGLLFRPAQCFYSDRVKYRIKYYVFCLLRKIQNVYVLTVLPFSIDPRLAKIARGWVYDPQLWDGRADRGPSEVATTTLAQDVLGRAGGRKIIVMLGGLQPEKGFDFFSDVWGSCAAVRQRYLFVAAGELARVSEGSAERLRGAGGVVIDRFISEQELHALYRIADIVWAAYAPNRDQASGIAGRAFQFGVPILLRRGSYLAKLMHDLHHPVIEVEWDATQDVAAKLAAPEAEPARTASRDAALRAMYRHFGSTLREAVEPRRVE
jgi:glycosyltransferase involved in cell wall biosynthesis